MVLSEADIIKFFTIIPDAEAPCATVGCEQKATKDGYVIQNGRVFHSEQCANRSARENAPLVKQQPKTRPYEGWDI